MKTQKSHLACTCIVRHLVILKDLSTFLAGSPQKDDAERIWMPCPGSDTLVGNTFPTTLPTQCRELCTSSFPNPSGHPASHMCWLPAKTRSLQSSHTKIQEHEVCFKGSWVAASRTFRKKEQKLFFLWTFPLEPHDFRFCKCIGKDTCTSRTCDSLGCSL